MSKSWTILNLISSFERSKINGKERERERK